MIIGEGKEVGMIGRLNHVAIVVPELGKAAALYRDALGARVSQPMALPAHGVSSRHRICGHAAS